MPSLHSFVFAAGMIAIATAANAVGAVRVNTLFTDHAVLQRDRPLPVWGTANAGESVTVRLGDRSVATMADAHGKWSVSLPPSPASAVPTTMSISGNPGEPTVQLHDLLVGDVWVCSGQSNMFRHLAPLPSDNPADNWQQEVATADHPTIRLITIVQGGAAQPKADASVGPGWEACTPTTVRGFSAVGYFFGRDLQADVKVPIGLIHSSVGGTTLALWASREALSSSPEFAPLVERWQRDVASYAARKAAFADKQKATTRPGRAPADPTNRSTTTLFNGMIAPLMPYGIRGAIWYQGESDANPTTQAERYRRLLPLMVADWRARWGQGDFPFLFVQVAPFSRTGPEIRESQRMALAHIPVSAMVVITDAGEAETIHPPHKQVVGERLSLAARAVAYGEPIEFSGPAYKSATFAGGEATVTFDHVGKGLVARNGPLRGFEIAGADGKFTAATATIQGATVIVRADGIAAPLAVRFGWAAVPDVNFFNADGLPASPFSSATVK